MVFRYDFAPRRYMHRVSGFLTLVSNVTKQLPDLGSVRDSPHPSPPPILLTDFCDFRCMIPTWLIFTEEVP